MSMVREDRQVALRVFGDGWPYQRLSAEGRHLMIQEDQVLHGFITRREHVFAIFIRRGRKE